MTTIAGCEIVETLYESANSIINRGRRTADNCPVILKRLRSDYPTPDQVARFKREYEMLRALAVDGVIQAYDLQPYQHTYVMVLEDFGGDSLANILKSKKLELGEFLDLAVRITDILAAIHQRNIMHKDINPSNIVWNPAANQLKIIDFGISTTLSREHPEIRTPEVLEGTFAYISPEQTGRMNRAMDYRTDLYSLGVTFYEMLTGHLPFQSNDPMELIHAHIAKTPVPPHEIPLPGGAGVGSGQNKFCTPLISDILMTLLAKTAEDRYQSAVGLKHDLRECQEQLRLTGRIEEFALRQHDVSDRFQIPQKLYGREQEVEMLLQAFSRISEHAEEKMEIAQSKIQNLNSKIEMLLVTGYAGIGKSSLVNEVQKPIVEKRGYFISGKYDQLKRNTPYSALIQAFQALVRQFLSESEERIAQWKSTLLTALGPNGQIIIEVIPEVRRIIGEQPVVPEMPPTESQNRFNYTFQNFVRTFAAPEHPLVLFLDDLQWADSPSLKLLELLMGSVSSMLIIGAYRNEEVQEPHPLLTMIGELHKAGTTVNTIQLSPLKQEHVNQLLTDTLNTQIKICTPLAELCCQKTQGNPFFLNQLLRTLYEDGFIEFDARQSIWQWDLQNIQQVAMTENVVELMTGKIQKLSAETQQALKLAACIGNQFDLDTLTVVNAQSKSETAVQLWQALEEGLVLPLDDSYKYVRSQTQQPSSQNPSYKFLHDRVQQAAYVLIDKADRQQVHLSIGRLLLANTPEAEREERIFDMVNHLNIGRTLISVQTERTELARLNLMAGKRAKASAAYQPAYNYLKVGLELLEKDCWQQQYELSLTLHEEAAESAYLSGDFEEMERLTSLVLQHTQELLDKIKVYEVTIQAYIGQNKLRKAVKLGLQVLKSLEIILPEKPAKLQILFGLLAVKFVLTRKKIEDLANLMEMKDPYNLAAIRILSCVGSACYLTAPELFSLVVFKALEISVRYGNAPASIVTYGAYGIILCVFTEDIDSGYRFGDLAIRLLEHFNAKEFEAKTRFVVNAFIKHWKEHAKDLLQPLWKVFQFSREIGDLEYAGYCISNYVLLSILTGSPLLSLKRDSTQFIDIIIQFKQTQPLYSAQIFHQTLLNLIEETKIPYLLTGESFNEGKILPLLYEVNDEATIFDAHLMKLILCYFFQEYPQAIENAITTQKYLNGAMGSFGIPCSYFYDSLACLALYSNGSLSERRQCLKKVAANQKKMKKWAYHAPMNHLHKWHLVEAERARVLGKTEEAIEYYDKAIAGARENEYLNEEALANELAATFYQAQGKIKIAKVYMREAYNCYRQWGALAKVKHLEKTYPDLLAAPIIGSGAFPSLKETYTATQTTTVRLLDLTTVVNAAQTISSEIVLPELLRKLMKLVMEQAGAQRGCLILKHNGNWAIEAEGRIAGSEMQVMLASIPIRESEKENIPRTVFNRVVNVHEPVILNNAAQQGDFSTDPYIAAHQSQSILCLPLLKQDTLAGVLYLEHNEATGAFTPERLELLRLISTQAAISLEHARLYDTLEQHVAERSQQLAAANQEMLESIAYARTIQRSLLPDNEAVKTYLPESFFLWMPLGIVSGDMFFTGNFRDGLLAAVIDCTGHDVPAALMSMLASSALRRIVHDEGCHDPAEILRRLNMTVKSLLKQDAAHASASDDGLEAAFCFIQPEARTLTFAGAGLPLYCVQKAEVFVLEGDSELVGYRRSNPDFRFRNHTLMLDAGMTFYLSTDGFLEQLGGKRQRRFGLSRFANLLRAHYAEPFDQQRERLLQAFESYRGTMPRQDDVAVAGFRIPAAQPPSFKEDEDYQIIFQVTGPVSQQVVKQMVETLKQQLAQQQADGARLRQLLPMVVENAQNILHYSAERVIAIGPDGRQKEIGCGVMTVGYKHTGFFVLCKNRIRHTEVERLRDKLSRLHQMTPEELNRYYEEQRSEGEPLSGRKGAGLGLIEVAKNASQPLEFAFEPIDEEYALFSLNVVI